MPASNNNSRRLISAALAAIALAAASPCVRAGRATTGAVTVNSAFPGGNVKVTHNEGGSVYVEPDLRGDNPWFYWCFEARAVERGRVSFVFPEKVAGFENGAIGFQGPAVSTDQGGTWKWMGDDNVRNNEFFYDFAAVPFVDKDGVEEGDQGKNRKPHDHNRDYGDESIYPEVQAIKELAEAEHFRFALDFHCPTLVMQDHQVMYFVGAKERPGNNFENVSELAKWIKKGLPENAPYGPLNWLRDETKPSPKNSRYFGSQDDMIMAATFEFPFAPPGKATDPASCRKYGQVMLQAWVNTHFLAPEP